MDRSETLRKIAEELNRRKQFVEALRLLIEDGDAKTALAMLVRFRAELDATIHQLQALEGDAPRDLAVPPPPETPAPSTLRSAALLDDNPQLSGFERWVESAIDHIWELLTHPGKYLLFLRRHKGTVIFTIALVVAVSTARRTYEVTFLARHGLIGEYHDGEGFNTLVSSRQDRRLDFRWMRRSPIKNLRADRFSVRWSGYVKVADAGEYEFYTVSDDGIRLFINDEKIIENWTVHSATLDKGRISLEPGHHRIVIEYFQREGDSAMKLQWKTPQTEEKKDIPVRILFPRQPGA